MSQEQETREEEETVGLPTVAVTQQHPNSKHIDVEQVLLYYRGNREGYHYGRPIRPCYIDALEEATEHEVGEVKELVRRSDLLDLMSKIASENWGGKHEATKHDWKNAWQTLCEKVEGEASE